MNLIFKNKNNMEKRFTEQESLAIITQMIEQTRNNLQKGSGNGMIFAGLMTAILAIINALLLFLFYKKGINTDYSMLVWILIIPCMFMNYLLQKNDNRKTMVKTHIDSIVSSAWIGYTYSAVVLLIVLLGISFGQKLSGMGFIITPVILTMVGAAGYVTAKACRFSPVGAFVLWLGTLACVGGTIWFTYPISIISHFFIFAICMIFGMALQGYQLNKLAKKNV